ncbi:exosome complex component RRP43-like [Watersipora subatra]|uniref:exosome complex component RRP43-like n=1 Tax=Watersipora subatra TaxID=2589382 RepID=UPI00355AEB76
MSAAREIQAYHRKEYLSKFIEQDVRPDNRGLGDTREARLTLGDISTADGSAMVKLGNTVVVCGIKAEITRPMANTPAAGVLVINVQLPPMCSPDFKPGPPSELAQVLSDYAQQVVTESQMVDMSQLCIESGLHCWILYCDIFCCNYDGNIRDAVILAAVGALKDLSLPTATYNSELEKISIDTDSMKQLHLSSFPIPLSFTIFDDRILLVDPTHEEEQVCQGEVTVITTGGDNICHLSKQGGPSLNPQQLALCITKAKQRWSDINKLLCSV